MHLGSGEVILTRGNVIRAMVRLRDGPAPPDACIGACAEGFYIFFDKFLITGQARNVEREADYTEQYGQPKASPAQLLEHNVDLEGAKAQTTIVLGQQSLVVA